MPPLCVDDGEGSSPVKVASALAFCSAFLNTDPAVIASVDFTSVSQLSPVPRSFSMPLPGSLGLNWLWRMRRTPFWSRRMAMCMYCPFLLV